MNDQASHPYKSTGRIIQKWSLHLTKILWEPVNQITLLVPYYISSRLVTLLKVTDAPIQVPNIFYLTVSFKFLNLTFRYSFF